MDNNRRSMRIRVDTYTRVCLTAIAVLLTVLIIGLWADHAPLADSARAEGPFLASGAQAQLVELLKAQQQTRSGVSELVSLLKTGQAKVQLIKPQATDTRGKTNASATTRTTTRK